MRCVLSLSRLAQNIAYDFTDGDRDMVQKQAEMLVNDYEVIPYRVITELTSTVAQADGLAFGSKREQLDLLTKILTQTSEADLRGADEADDLEITRSGGGEGDGAAGGGAGVKRKTGSMSELSGASQMVYAERDARPGHVPQNKISREFGKAQKAKAKAVRQGGP